MLPLHQLSPTLDSLGCGSCREGEGSFPMELTMAFQPIVNTHTRTVYAYEALVRGAQGATAGEVLALVNDQNRYVFDQSCRVKAIALAANLGLHRRNAKLSLNFMPGAVYSPAACIRKTLAAAHEQNFPLDRIIFELTENEKTDIRHLQSISQEYARHGFTLALDDLGAGYSGLNLLATLEGIGMVKLDGKLTRAACRTHQAASVVSAMVSLCHALNIDLVAECIETEEEYAALRRHGIHLMQGYLFARPQVATLPAIHWPEVPELEAAGAADPSPELHRSGAVRPQSPQGSSTAP